jgi:hypothetical protein
VSLGTYSPTTKQYYQIGILPRNNSGCGYTYLINNTEAVSITYTVSTNLTSAFNITLKINNSAVFNNSLNGTIVVGAGATSSPNITWDYLNRSALLTDPSFTLTWTAVTT